VFGAPTSADSVSLSIIGSGKSTVSGVSVLSPLGDPFLNIDEVVVDADLRSMFSKLWHFEELALETVIISIYQQPDGKTNVETIINHLKEFIRTHKTKSGEKIKNYLMNKLVIVDRLRFSNISFAVNLPVLSFGHALPFYISEVVVYDVGRAQNGVPVVMLLARVIMVLMQALLQKVPKEYTGMLSQRLLKGLEDVLDPVEVRINLGKGLVKIGEKLGSIMESVGNRTEHVGESIAGAIENVVNNTEHAIETPFDNMMRKAPSDVISGHEKKQAQEAFHKWVEKPFEAAHRVADAIEKGTEKAGDALDRAGDKTSQGVGTAGEAVARTPAPWKWPTLPPPSAE